jgi:hypothetical protein
LFFAEVLIPSLQKLLPVLRDKPSDFAQLAPPETVIEGEGDGLKPELRFVLGRLDVYVRRLLTLVAEKEEAESAYAQHRRHVIILCVENIPRKDFGRGR